MQWLRIIQKVTALLSRMYLVSTICLITWAVLPLAIGWTPTVVMSGSMLPNVQIGDVIVAQNLSPAQKEELISVGNVLLATDPLNVDRLITHRVVNVIKGSGFITKGDANATADATIIPLSNVHGIERLRIPMIGIPIEASRAGDFIPLTVFTALTLFAQFVVLHERKTSKQPASPKTQSLRKTQSSDLTLRKKPLLRIINVVVVSIILVGVSFSMVSSAAAFTGANANGGSSFIAMANFTAAYKNAVMASSPFAYYRLDESSGATAVDSSGNSRNAIYNTKGITFNASGALTRDSTDTAVTLDGTQSTITSSSSTTEPQSVTTEVWFKTSTTSGGKLIGFSNGTSNSTVVDRVLYMNSAGNVIFGVDSAAKSTIQTPLSYNDGKWHMATATLSGLTSALYIDGQQIASGTTTNPPTTATGFWLIGGGNFAGWPNQPANGGFVGSIDEVAIYNKALTSAQIAAVYGAA